MKRVLFLASVLAIATVCSQTKESYLDGFKLFVESVQKNAQNYAKTSREKADKQFTKLKDSYNKFSEQIALNKKDEIAKLESTYTVLKLKKTGNGLKEGAEDALEKAKDTARDVTKDVKEGTQRAVKKGERVMEGIKDGLKNQSRLTGLHASDR